MAGELRAYNKLGTRSAPIADWGDPVVEDENGFDVSLRQCHTALNEFNGRMAKAARKLAVPLLRFQRVVQNIPVLFEIVQLNRELLLDNAEAAVEAAVIEGDSLVAMQVLKSIGKHRGWTDKDGINERDTKIEIVYVEDWRQTHVTVDADSFETLPEPNSIESSNIHSTTSVTPYQQTEIQTDNEPAEITTSNQEPGSDPAAEPPSV